MIDGRKNITDVVVASTLGCIFFFLDLDLGTPSPNVEPSNIATIAASVTVTVIVVVALVVAGIISPIVIIICIKVIDMTSFGFSYLLCCSIQSKRIEVDFTNQASFIVEVNFNNNIITRLCLH